jgi:hypothetical protein
MRITMSSLRVWPRAKDVALGRKRDRLVVCPHHPDQLRPAGLKTRRSFVAPRRLCAHGLAFNDRKSTASSRSCSRSTARRDLMRGMTRRTSFARLRPTTASIRPSFT